MPASYGQASYHGEHAFRFTASDDTSRFGRYHWVPEAGEAYLSPDEASTRNANFLREELESRMRNSPVVFHLLLQLAGEGDPTDDVTALWPADRTMVELGRLEVTGISPTSAADERRLDPTNLTDGIDLSADPQQGRVSDRIARHIEFRRLLISSFRWEKSVRLSITSKAHRIPRELEV